MTNTITEPQIWVGCLAHYNAGSLVGEWFPISEAPEIDLAAVHRHTSVTPSCEELWIMDSDGLPLYQEMDLLTAADWAEVYDEVPEYLWPALAAWVQTGSYVAQGTGNVPAPDEFLDHLAGEYDDFRDFAESWLAETDYFDHWPDAAKQYFDLDSFARDLAFDFITAPAPGGGVFVFTSN